MIVCVCNRLSDRDVENAILSGAETWQCVHRHHGVAPNCGSCEEEMSDAIDRTRAMDAASPPMAAAAE